MRHPVLRNYLGGTGGSQKKTQGNFSCRRISARLPEYYTLLNP